MPEKTPRFPKPPPFMRRRRDRKAVDAPDAVLRKGIPTLKRTIFTSVYFAQSPDAAIIA